MAKMDERLTGWIGLDLYDSDGRKIGPVVDVRYGEYTGGLVWLVVKTGLFGWKKVVVPANEVDKDGGRLVARYDKGRVKSAPGIDASKILGDDDEQKFCTYYGLDFVSSPWKAEEGCVEDEGQGAQPGAGSTPGAGS